MELTAIIIFFGALISLILWILKLVITLNDPKYRVQMMMGAKVTVGVRIPIILFFIIAISAGMAWG